MQSLQSFFLLLPAHDVRKVQPEFLLMVNKFFYAKKKKRKSIPTTYMKSSRLYYNNKEFERIAYIKYNLYFMQNKNILGT